MIYTPLQGLVQVPSLESLRRVVRGVQLSEEKLVLNRLEESINVSILDGTERGRRPLGLVVLINKKGTNSFEEVGILLNEKKKRNMKKKIKNRSGEHT